MTQNRESEQDRQWRLYACGPRCLIESQRGRNQNLTKAAIIAAFKPRVPWWGKECGLSTPDILLDIARHFGLHRIMQLTRDVDRVVEFLVDSRTTVIAQTEKSGDGTTRLAHYYLVESAWTANNAEHPHLNFRLFTALQQGGESQFDIRESRLEVQLPTFLVFT